MHPMHTTIAANGLAAKKRTIMELWGVASSEIDNKLSILQCIISDVSPLILLDYLLKADLNIDQAINLHFGSTPTPPPQNIQSNNINTNINSNNSIVNIESTSSNNTTIQSTISSSSHSNNNTNTTSTELTTISSSNRSNNTSSTELTIISTDSFNTTNSNNNINPLFDNDDSDIELLLDANYNNKQNRKRKADDIYEQGINYEPPRNKRRKINFNISHESSCDNTNNANNSNNSNNSNVNNSNVNNSNSDNIIRPFAAVQLSQNVNNIIRPLATLQRSQNVNNFLQNIHNIRDPNWKKKLIVVLRVKIVQTQKISLCQYSDCTETIDRIVRQLRHKQIKLELIDSVPALQHLTHGTILNEEVLNNCISDLTTYSNSISVSMRNKQVISNNINQILNYQRKYAAEHKVQHTKLLRSWRMARFSTDEKEDVIKRFTNMAIGVLETYSVEICAEMTRKINPKALNYKVNIPHIIALISNSQKSYDNIVNAIKIGEKYREEKHDYNSMVSLLDFACRNEYEINETNNNESFNHGLNVQLHDYQLQSLQFMIQEENEPLGFYRHFYENGHFPDGTPFYYSATFNDLILDKKEISIAHGGFLCEEMGLGKTIISLALINCNQAPLNLNTYSTKHELKIGHRETRVQTRANIFNPSIIVRYNKEYIFYKSSATLIIAPVSLVGQWEKECDEKSRKKIKYNRYYGSRSRNVGHYIEQDIVFTTYGILGIENGDKNEHILHQIEWHRIILDESHYIKNGNCKTSKNINLLRGINKWCLSGTPFGRKLYDIHNQLKFVGMKFQHLQSLDLKTICNYGIFKGCVDWQSSRSKADPLLMVVKSMVMRHIKCQQFNKRAIVSLPDKQENVIFVNFTEKERIFYDKLYATAKERFNYYKSIGSIGRGTISILSSLHASRQACSGCIYKKINIEQELLNAEAKTLHIQSMVNCNKHRNLSEKELFEMAKQEAFNYDDDGECPICYECPYEEPLQTPCRHIFCKECIISILHAKAECPMCRTKCKISQLKQPPSNNNNNNNNEKEEIKYNNENEEIRFDSKLKVLMNELEKIRENSPNEKALIFTSFSKSLTWMCSELKQNGFEYRTLTGSMTMNKRKKQLNEFSSNPNVKVFVLTVRSGAVGITLTSANHVFILEPPFNNALYKQAINRVYRLGQKKKVYIKTLIIKNSIEEKIWNINQHKHQNNNNTNNCNYNRCLAGNISRDKSANLKQHEIEKLFV